ncbi:hypothetical protein ACQ4LE_006502 [Meloidogyne hapla]
MKPPLLRLCQLTTNLVLLLEFVIIDTSFALIQMPMQIKSVEHIIFGRHRRQSTLLCRHFSTAIDCENNDNQESEREEQQQGPQHYYSVPVMRSERIQSQHYGQSTPFLWNSLLPKCRACDASTDENCVQLRITIRNCNDDEEGDYWTRMIPTQGPHQPTPAPPTPPYLPYLPPPTAPIPPPPLTPYPPPPPLQPLPSLPPPLPMPPPCISIGSPCPTNAFLITVRPVQAGGIPFPPPPASLAYAPTYSSSQAFSPSQALLPFAFHPSSQQVAPLTEQVFHPPAMPLQPQVPCQRCCRKCPSMFAENVRPCISMCWPSFEVLGCDENTVPDNSGHAESG